VPGRAGDQVHQRLYQPHVDGQHGLPVRPAGSAAAGGRADAAGPADGRAQGVLVFFDWDRATITAEGMGVVQQAADA